jgi:hypothetical protein
VQRRKISKNEIMLIVICTECGEEIERNDPMLTHGDAIRPMCFDCFARLDLHGLIKKLPHKRIAV